MKHGLIIALSLFASEAVAQDDVVFHRELVQQCFDKARSYGGSDSCIGSAADLCMEQNEGGYSTYGMSYCISLESEWWDEMLNFEYSRVLSEAAFLDGELSEDLPSVAEALREMQRAWITYRDASCAFEAAQWGGGTGAGPAYNGCVMRLTAEQAITLGGSFVDF
ncbi:lysozyme inhibitor LprI family protein [Rhodovulum sp. FJ3]|uniref:lysozyme inhibitor LprI family protein n=1 Tax=Rhodovulum sp. FJ3 TaxID=3079053 RepID=UPI00293DAC3D|nr:lysozyme inhibitor LprI family protein [Rhodovulum sp. FJ3]MDV4167698.1 lysozyme inhibitor LprI family protein [Rhodovulum sp. FJ3]